MRVQHPQALGNKSECKLHRHLLGEKGPTRITTDQVSMLPESIIQSGPMTQMGPGFNVTMRTRKEDEGEGMPAGGHGQRMVRINMLASSQIATQAPSEVKPGGGLHALLANITNAPDGLTKSIPEVPQAQVGKQGGGLLSGARSFLGSGGAMFGFGAWGNFFKHTAFRRHDSRKPQWRGKWLAQLRYGSRIPRSTRMG